MQALKKKIAEHPLCAITYSTFIETALYDFFDGYYMKDIQKIGQRGDFITTSSISDVYGELMAHFFIKKSKEENLPLSVYEIGGGDGRFANKVIETFLKEEITQFSYTIVEISPYHRRCQNNLLKEYEQIKIVESLEEIDEVEGIVFSNELFDAFPVHIIEKFQGDLFEVFVTWDGEKYAELYFPLEDESILTYLENHQIQLANHQRFEVPLSVELYLRELYKKMKKGLLITVDYGVTSEELAHPSRLNGTIRGYYHHQLVENILEHPGMIDITYHVHWDEYLQICDDIGFVTLTQLSQKEFFLKENVLSYLVPHESRDPFSKVAKRNRGIHSLIMDGGISDSFQVIIQKKQ